MAVPYWVVFLSAFAAEVRGVQQVPFVLPPRGEVLAIEREKALARFFQGGVQTSSAPEMN